MKTNNDSIYTFSLGRTMSLIHKIVMEQPRIFLMRILLLVGVLSTGTVLIGITNSHSPQSSIISIELGFFAVMLFVLGLVYTSMTFSEAGSRGGRISLLMLPARNIEKFIARFVVYVPLYLVAFGLAVFLADAVRAVIMKIVYYNIAGNIRFISVEDFFNEDTSITLALFLGMQSFYLLGSIIWPRFSLIKTFAAVAVLNTFITVMCMLIYYFTLAHGNFYYKDPTWLNVRNLSPANIVWTFSTIVCLINYSISYLRMRETDVIQRVL